MRIPITMCHAISDEGDYPLKEEHFDALVSVVRELGFESIDCGPAMGDHTVVDGLSTALALG